MGLQLQSFDQEFDKMNLALKVSCLRGLPVRVVRSYKVASSFQLLLLPSMPRAACMNRLNMSCVKSFLRGWSAL